MTLREIIKGLENTSDEFVIFATKRENWDLDAPAVLIHVEDEVATGTTIDGLTYFLEVDIAKEVLSVWSQWRNGREPNDSERIEALKFYVENDAYIE